MPKLCSFGCAPSGFPMHRFPNAFKFPEPFKAWVNLVGGKLESASDYEYYRNKLICDIHFTPEDRVRNNRLKAYAIPSLHLLEKPARVSDIGCCQPSTSNASNTGSSASFMTEQEPPLNVANRTLSHISASPANTDIVKKEKTVDSEGNPTLSVRKNPEINSLPIEEKQNSTGVIKTTYPVRKRTDYIRREVVMRIKHLENKKKMEMQILKTKLEVQMIKRKSALLEEERNKILLQKAKIEFEELKKSILT
ncbi:unnamed protein product [Parnassius mnemosyne]|uniref:THAP-type domain-containing protein n=1 Tax=Parnassius mnemosyne TaxID=213953 RepID=A0AAV1LG65_9NEOP